MDMVQDGSDAPRDWLGNMGRITVAVMQIDLVVAALVLYFIPPPIGMILGGPDYSSFGSILIISIYSTVIYVLAYFLVLRRARTTEVRKLVTRSAILAFFAVTTILLLPVGICLAIIAYLASNESKNQYLELHGHYENETVFTSPLGLEDDSPFRLFQRVRFASVILSFILLLVYTYQLYLSSKGVFLSTLNLILSLVIIATIIIGLFAQRTSLKRIFPFLPGREGTVKRIRKGRRMNCIVNIAGIRFNGYCPTEILIGDPVVVKSCVFNRDEFSRSLVTVVLAHNLIR